MARQCCAGVSCGGAQQITDAAQRMNLDIGSRFAQTLAQAMDRDLDAVRGNLVSEGIEAFLNRVLRHDASLAAKQDFEKVGFATGKGSGYAADRNLPSDRVEGDISRNEHAAKRLPRTAPKGAGPRDG